MSSDKIFKLEKSWAVTHRSGAFADLVSRAHEWHELMLVVNGTLDMHTDDGVYICRAPSLLIIPAFTAHLNRASDKYGVYERYVAQWQTETLPNDVIDMEKYGRHCVHIQLNEKERDFFITAFERMVHHRTAEFFRLMMPPVIYEADRLKRSTAINVETDREYISDVRKYIDENYSKQLIAADIAKMFGVSRTKLFCDFKKVQSIKLHEYIINIRMNHATELIVSGMRVTETAWQCGFESDTHLRRCFKAYTGMTPSEYRKSKQL